MIVLNLKHCPFCGGKASLVIDPNATKDTEGRLWAYTIVCDRCAASSGLGWSEKMISESWNRRVNDGADQT